MKKMIAAIAALTAITAISACSAQALAPEETFPAAAETAPSAVTALETTEDSRAEGSDEVVVTEEVAVYGSDGLPAPDAPEDDTVCFGCGSDSSAEYKNSVFIISVEPDTTDETMSALFEKYGLDIVYDYENFNMYAVSVSEPLDAEQTDKFIKALEEYDFILMVEPDSVVYIDSSAEVK